MWGTFVYCTSLGLQSPVFGAVWSLLHARHTLAVVNMFLMALDAQRESKGGLCDTGGAQLGAPHALHSSDPTVGQKGKF